MWDFISSDQNKLSLSEEFCNLDSLPKFCWAALESACSRSESVNEQLFYIWNSSTVSIHHFIGSKSFWPPVVPSRLSITHLISSPCGSRTSRVHNRPRRKGWPQLVDSSIFRLSRRMKFLVVSASVGSANLAASLSLASKVLSTDCFFSSQERVGRKW